ncbi:MAG: multicopper oxidase domain-containing protein [Nitrospirae bacterium]|nr:multicopper oxidase domain-containing protein [Nitrospirota bacterium]
MKMRYRYLILAISLLLFMTNAAIAAVNVQCPGVPDRKCVHLSSGDGFVQMADGTVLFIFGFSDVTNVINPQAVLSVGELAATFSAPTIEVSEGDQFYLTLTNVGMKMRPDLFDPHTVHFHGFPNASTIFDGEPMASIAINQGASLTYYYNIVEPGTYLYHCHVEATEHMQMGMLGNLYVHPSQNGKSINGFTKFVYNDGDGSTGYDVEFPLQVGSFDPRFHIANLEIEPLPFAGMKDTYPMFNGRGYPDTVNPGVLPSPLIAENNFKPSQPISSLITATKGQRILLRISSVSTVDFHTVTVLGIPMKVVGKDARMLRGPAPDYRDLSYYTNSLQLGGGETADVILDTTGISPGTYFVYTTNLEHLSNNEEDFGGMMTEIIIN